MDNKDIYRHRILDRLVTLQTIKNEDGLVDKQPLWKEKMKAKRTQPKAKDRSDVKTDLALTVKLTKDAELLAWLQEYEFMPMDDIARSNIPIFRKVWDYWWMMSRTDKVLTQVIPSATSYWTGIMYEWIKTITKKVKEPELIDGRIEFKEEVRTIYDWIYCEYIPWENFYIDWDDIDNANEAVWIKHWDRDEYIKAHELDAKYMLSDIPRYKEYLPILTADDPRYWLDDDEIITELKYYNLSKDEYIIVANGKEVLNTPIPYKHKELPFGLYSDYKVDGRIWGMWENELLEEDEIYKDKLRSLSIDVIKAQMWLVMMESGVDFEESTFEYWTSSYVVVDDINGIKHFAPSISTNSIDNAEAKLDNDVIAKTWVDIKAQIFGAWETAKKTTAKTESGKKKINLNLKVNWFDFFERIWRLRASNIQLIMSEWEKKIPIKWMDIKKNWVATAVNGWYGFFTVTPDRIKWAFNLIPITDSILGNTKDLNKRRALELDNIIGNIVWADGKPVIAWEKRVERLCEVFEVDYEKLTAAVDAQKKPEDILKELQNDVKGVPNDTTNPANPDFIPPEQRSWATKMMWWLSANWIE